MRVVNSAGLFGSDSGRAQAEFELNFDKKFELISGHIQRLQINYFETSLFCTFYLLGVGQIALQSCLSKDM